MGAIVNSTHFDLSHVTGVARALADADPGWNEDSKNQLDANPDFHERGKRAIITPTFELKKQGVNWIINVVGPYGFQEKWEEKLNKTYLDALSVANKNKLKSIIFPPISTDKHKITDIDGKKVVITPDKATTIAIAAVDRFINETQELFLQEIYFISRPGEDDLPYFTAYKKALQNLYTLKYPIRAKLRVFFEKIKKWKKELSVGTFAILASLYLLKKYYPSQ